MVEPALSFAWNAALVHGPLTGAAVPDGAAVVGGAVAGGAVAGGAVVGGGIDVDVDVGVDVAASADPYATAATNDERSLTDFQLVASVLV